MDRFYRAALLGLCALDARRGKRQPFGPDAEARWRAFRGELLDCDRLDLLIRDAALTHPNAFAPRLLFSLEGLLPDEPFGPDWPGLADPQATALINDARATQTTNLTSLLAAAARIWDLTPGPVSPEVLTNIRPATRIVAAGAGAVLALADHFEARSDLDLADQVILIASDPGPRQLFGLAVAWLGCPSPPKILSPVQATAGSAHVTVAVISNDASTEASEASSRLLTEMGG